ncbi:MAG: hypothetical protein EXS64_04175 [Candidatus Latescibacteria bacterium]|nr:hypothetical protein [Candidatus Latescibacterota bacterium]
MAGFVNDMVRAAKLDASLYEEVEADPSALGRAMGVVLLSSLAAGIGSAQVGGVLGIFWGMLSSLLGWYIWSFLTYIIGTKILSTAETNATYGELLRTVGFSSAPGVIQALGIVPGLRGIALFVASVWMLATMVVAVRQALDYQSTMRAVGVCLIGWVIQMLILAMMLVLTGGVPKPG